MEVVRGQIVASRRGRDVTGFYVVVGQENGRLLLCDGGKRTLDAPKPKNPLHVAPTKTLLAEQEMETDQKLKEALKVYESRKGPPEEGG